MGMLQLNTCGEGFRTGKGDCAGGIDSTVFFRPYLAACISSPSILLSMLGAAVGTLTGKDACVFLLLWQHRCKSQTTLISCKTSGVVWVVCPCIPVPTLWGSAMPIRIIKGECGWWWLEQQCPMRWEEINSSDGDSSQKHPWMSWAGARDALHHPPHCTFLMRWIKQHHAGSGGEETQMGKYWRQWQGQRENGCSLSLHSLAYIYWLTKRMLIASAVFSIICMHALTKFENGLTDSGRHFRIIES